MPDPKTILDKLIEENGGKLVRQSKHKVYHFPNGQVFTCATTPSCPLAYNNAVTKLKNLLGVNPPDRGTPGERREKRDKQRSKQVFSVSGTPSQPVVTWKEKLVVAAMQLTPPNAKRPIKQRPRPRVLTFEERMLHAGVRRIQSE